MGGQRLVAVTTMDPGRHDAPAPAHRSCKHAPQLSPLPNSAVLSAVVSVPYPWLYRLP